MITTADYDRLFSDTPLELNDGTFVQIPPHPRFELLGDDQTDAYEELIFEAESYDRAEDVQIPAVTEADGRVIPARTVKGPLLEPYQKNGKLVKPAFRVRVAQAALGDEEYARLRAGGKNASDVYLAWAKQSAEIQALQDADD